MIPARKAASGRVSSTNVLVEIGQRSLAKAVDGESSAIAEINFIGIQLKNLLLGETVLQFQCHHGFGNLATPGAFA